MIFTLTRKLSEVDYGKIDRSPERKLYSSGIVGLGAVPDPNGKHRPALRGRLCWSAPSRGQKKLP